MRRFVHRITIQQNVPSVGADGSPANVWFEFRQAWAEIQPLSAREAQGNGTLNTMTDLRVTCRRTAEVTSRMRVLWGARVLEILGVLDVRFPMPGETVLICREVNG